jgi:hypothetical protein
MLNERSDVFEFHEEVRKPLDSFGDLVSVTNREVRYRVGGLLGVLSLGDTHEVTDVRFEFEMGGGVECVADEKVLSLMLLILKGNVLDESFLNLESDEALVQAFLDLVGTTLAFYNPDLLSRVEFEKVDLNAVDDFLCSPGEYDLSVVDQIGDKFLSGEFAGADVFKVFQCDAVPVDYKVRLLNFLSEKKLNAHTWERLIESIPGHFDEFGLHYPEYEGGTDFYKEGHFYTQIDVYKCYLRKLIECSSVE